MGYTQRLLIGVIILFSAYALFNDAEYRHQFHLVADLIKQKAGLNLGCYLCLEKLRQLVVAFIFTAGLSLILDFGVTVAIVGQLLWLVFEIVPLRDGASLSEIQWVVINTVILLFLVKTKCQSCQQAKKQKQQIPVPSSKVESKFVLEEKVPNVDVKLTAEKKMAASAGPTPKPKNKK